MLRKLINLLPNIRGKQRTLVALDQLLGSQRLRARHGIKLECYLSSAQDQSFLKTTIDNQLLESEVASLSGDNVFVDCGANIGFYSGLAARNLGDGGLVVSLEPSYREFRRLLGAVQMNSHVCSWLPLNVALGSSSKMVFLDAHVGHTGMNRVCIDKKLSCATSLQLRLDDIIDAVLGQTRVINLLKVDVEGYEMEVLGGASRILSRGQVRKLVIEVTDQFLRSRGSSKQQLYDFLRSFNYEGQVFSDAWQYDEIFSINRN